MLPILTRREDRLAFGKIEGIAVERGLGYFCTDADTPRKADLRGEKTQMRDMLFEQSVPERIYGGAKKGAGSIFVVHEHDATRLHYDLRLEMGGILRSWAVPKEPPEKEGVRRLAIQTEDHPLEYADFEGTIPEGMYGAGTVRIWDRGELTVEEEKEDELLFELKGRRLAGRYALIKTRFRGKDSWLFLRGNEISDYKLGSYIRYTTTTLKI